jgi:hypothetical protein
MYVHSETVNSKHLAKYDFQICVPVDRLVV